MEENPIDYRVRIKQLLAVRINDTIEDLAKQAGINSGTIRSWYHRGSDPKAADLLKIAGALNTTVEFLLTGEEPEIRQSYDNEIQERVCEYLKSLDQESLLHAEGCLKLIKAISLAPEINKIHKETTKKGAAVGQ